MGLPHIVSSWYGVCLCTQEVSYANNVIRFKLVAGLIDEEIKEDVLGTANLDLEATVKMIEGKEGAKKSETVTFTINNRTGVSGGKG